MDKTVILKLDACPCCDGEISELEQTRERYTEDIVPLTLYITKYIIKQGYCKNVARSFIQKSQK
ncbi:MAG: IS66 family transposase zinc-finger binding domain-containing protein [Candidatus Methanoperedens sp.]|nr:IS66 family transposase zinc-finger binding domain-containing protein [Candidatus Methanoperedens sp.]MDJ1421448.1 IS66 family transposase zinc-finger binding domain-containing protein [Candidatus Methanoperedens sp.]